LKRLIINADDLGADEGRNAGIFEAIEAGSVTAASILANGPAFQDVIRRIDASACKHVSYGIHLNLTEGMPLTAGPGSMAGADGCFRGKKEGHRLFMTEGDGMLERDIMVELSAQIEALRNAGIRISHLDGHQHVHIFPAVIQAAIRSGLEFGIPWIRIPEEPIPVGIVEQTSHDLRDEAAMFSHLASAARLRIRKSTLVTSDHFRGLYLKGRLSLERLEETLRALPPGLTELMVHPGRVSASRGDGAFSSFSNSEREYELKTLVDEKIPAMLAMYNLTLTPFPEVLP
jgi:predicted glycoside hydrolase/deacetylase ChbG (UPF0249 family)